jgi:hypothetical protein
MAGIDSYVVFGSHFDGADGATTATDFSTAQAAKTITFGGNAQLDTAQSVFGTASLLLDGTGDYTQLARSTDFDFGSGDFTIDMRVRFNSVTAADFMTSYSSSTNRGWIFGYQSADSKIKLYADNNGTENVGVSWTPSTATWYHVAVVRSTTSIFFFIDGTQVGTTQTASLNGYNGDSAEVERIGLGPVALGALNGWIDEIRVSKGIARWTSGFTPPSAAYSSDSANTSNFFQLF